MFTPNIQQMATPIRIKHRVETIVNGAPDVSYEDAIPALSRCNWKKRGGTEGVEAGVLTVLDTAEVILWYRPDITETDRILLNDNKDLIYEVVSVENIEMRNRLLILKVKRVVNA